VKIIFGFAYLEIDREDGRPPKIVNARWSGEDYFFDEVDSAAERVARSLGKTLKRKVAALDA
jgi:hypothetical protein